MKIAVELADTDLKNKAPDQICKLRLRMLATSDVHAHLLAWDYYADRASDGVGLVRVAALIRQARAEAANCVYFDNGDLIEGSPLGEFVVQQSCPDISMVHPMIAALNALGCDAATLGNHEFSYGMPFLEAALRGADYPVVTANILRHKGSDAAQDVPVFTPWVILDRVFVAEDGRRCVLRIGVLGLTPPQVLDWDKAQLPSDLQARDMLAVAAHHIPLLRAAGADIVVVLAHTGVGAEHVIPLAENVGRQLAALPGIDALILGHEHLVFPAQVVPEGGQLGGVAAVMPGTYGSHLGLIDLDLEQTDLGWRVVAAQSAVRPIARHDEAGGVVALVADDAGLVAQAAGAHVAARAWMARPVGQSDVALHSYFALVQPTAMQALIAEAQADHLRHVIARTEFAHLPVLSAVAPFKVGGRGGAEHFTAIAPGPLLMRHAADLYVHPNVFAAVAVTGADVLDWLELAVSSYAQVMPGMLDQALLNTAFPATCLEMIAGLDYAIDLSVPGLHAYPAAAAQGGVGRIRGLRFQGRAVTPDMQFALATNSHRMGIVASRWRCAPQMIDDPQGLSSRAVLLRYLARGPQVSAVPPLGWRFCAVPGASVVLETAAAGVDHVAEIAAFRPVDIGRSPDGFQRFRLHL